MHARDIARFQSNRSSYAVSVDLRTEAKPRPWISVYDQAFREGWFVVCWACPHADGGQLSKTARKIQAVRRFIAAHRHCGMALEPAPDPRSPHFEARIPDMIDELEERS